VGGEGEAVNTPLFCTTISVLAAVHCGSGLSGLLRSLLYLEVSKTGAVVVFLGRDVLVSTGSGDTFTKPQLVPGVVFSQNSWTDTAVPSKWAGWLTVHPLKKKEKTHESATRERSGAERLTSLSPATTHDRWWQVCGSLR